MANEPSSATTSATIWHSVDDIDETAWEAVRKPDDLFMDFRLLRIVEKSMSPQARFRYVLFHDHDGRPAAITCLCTYVIDGTLLVEEGTLKRFLGLVGKAIPLVVKYKVLFCGLPFSAGQSHLRFTHVADRPAILSELCRILDDVARTDRARVIVLKEFNDDERESMDHVEQHGYRRAESLPLNLMHPQHPDFDEYLASFRSDKRRDIRRSLKRLEKTGVIIRNTSDPAEIERRFTPEVHDLYSAVFQRSETKLEYLPREFFLEIPRQLPQNCNFTFLLDGESVLAFASSVFSEDAYYGLFTGVNYQRNAESHLYFNLMLAGFADALRRNVDTFFAGQGADDVKRSKLGCHQKALSFYVKGTRPPIRLALRLLFKQIFPERPLTEKISAD
ncbi:MAG: GNAT family N-acetyltransferase [Planctomycetaceae bacterium]